MRLPGNVVPQTITTEGGHAYGQNAFNHDLIGLIYGTVQLSNPSSPELQGLEVRALAPSCSRSP